MADRRLIGKLMQADEMNTAHGRRTSYGLPYPEPSSQGASTSMRGNRARDTKPEIAIRRLVHRAGYRFRKNVLLVVAGQRVRPDVVFPRKRVAVFIDGCFWHGCPRHGRVPQTNVDYWRPKLQRNIDRDVLQSRALGAAGWTVLRFWEHVHPDDVAEAIITVLEDSISWASFGNSEVAR